MIRPATDFMTHTEFEAHHAGMNRLEIAARWWEKLARDEIALRESNHCESQAVSVSCEKTYWRVAQALRLEIPAGKPHCACCLKPIDECQRH